MNKYNIIADIAGRFDELQELLKLMPPAEKVILVGDLMDRGPKSKDVIKWAMNTANVITLLGNHELMMIEASEGDPTDHLWNGGKQTLKSYRVKHPSEYLKSHINWMSKLPLYFRDEGLLVSHAPWYGELPTVQSKLDPFHVTWNREEPEKIEGVFQIHGHNSKMKKYGDWGMCIDDCFNNRLCGITWPNKEIFQVNYK